MSEAEVRIIEGEEEARSFYRSEYILLMEAVHQKSLTREDFRVISDLLLFQTGDSFPKPNVITLRNFF